MNKKYTDFNLNGHDLKLLPFSDEIEMHVLETILNEPDEYYPLGLKFLKAKGMFYDELNAGVWEIIVEVSKTGKLSIEKVRGVIDGQRNPVTLNHFLTVCKTPSTPANFQTNCLLLNEFWIKRTMHRMGYYVNQNALTTPDSLELLGICTDSIDKIYRHIAQMTEVTLGDGVTELSKEIYDISVSPDGMLGLKSSISGINRAIKGYRRGNLIGIGASTGEGKTTLECQEIRFMIEAGIPVGCFSLEMKTSELILMMSCDAMGISTETVLSGAMGAAGMSQLGGYMDRVKKMPLKISDKPAIKIGELKSIARMWKKNNGIKILFIDHVHLMEGDVQYSNAEQKFTSLANELKALAKELDIPVVALLQLARKEKGDKSMHVISDIKYASGIEQACDVIMLIYRPELYDIETFADGVSTKGYAKIHIGKLRLLPKSDVICHFSGLRFEDKNEFDYKQKKEPLRDDPFIAQPDNPRAGFQPPRELPTKDFWNNK